MNKYQIANLAEMIVKQREKLIKKAYKKRTGKKLTAGSLIQAARKVEETGSEIIYLDGKPLILFDPPVVTTEERESKKSEISTFHINADFTYTVFK